MKLGKVFLAIALILVASGFLWITITPRYDTTFEIGNYTSATYPQLTPITVKGTLSASLDMPYALMLIIIGFVFAFLAILVDDRTITVETTQAKVE